MSSPTMSYPQNDGSEDGGGQVPDPSLRMNGSTPASELRAWFGSNPLFAVDEERPKMLEGRDAEELSLYWESRATCEQARATITELFQGMTGQRWVEILTSSDAESAEMLLKEDCGIASRPDRMMLKADAVSAHARMKADSELSSQSDLRSQFMAEAEAANARMKERMEARLLAAQEV